MVSDSVRCLAILTAVLDISTATPAPTMPTESPTVKGGRALLKTSLGVHVTVLSNDGYLRLGSNSSGSGVFTVVPVSASMVDLLSSVYRTDPVDSNGVRPMTLTRSGCKCSGFSNAHGFGAYCAAWEEDFQPPWCYVDDDCVAVSSKGSFGLKSQRCDPDETPVDFIDRDLGFGEPTVLGGWRAPEGCPCSGYRNRHGYGDSCKAWEEVNAPGQTPWCYTTANCSHYGGKRGSFGHRHIECEPFYESSPPQASPPPPSPPPPPPPPPPSPPKLTRLQRKRRRALAHEVAAAELTALARAGGVYMAFVCASTGGFASVRPPPDKAAMMLTAGATGLSVQTLFSLLPSGHLFALGTRALVGLCAEPGTSAPLLCTGYRQRPGDPHRKLLRSTAARSALKFTIQAL